MNNSRTNDAISHSDDIWTEYENSNAQQASLFCGDDDNDKNVWTPKPCLDALWPPINIHGRPPPLPPTKQLVNTTCSHSNALPSDIKNTIVGGELPSLFPFDTLRAATPETIPPYNAAIGVPTTIAIPGSSLVTPETETLIRDIELPTNVNHKNDDDDDCSTVGMETNDKEQHQGRLKRPLNDDATMESMVELKRIKSSSSSSHHDDSITNNKDDSLSHADDLAEYAWLMSDFSFETGDNVETIGASDVLKSQVSNKDDDDDSSCSSCSTSDLVVISKGTSIPQVSSSSVWDGTLSFQDVLGKHDASSLADFCSAELQAECFAQQDDAETDTFLPPNFMWYSQ